MDGKAIIRKLGGPAKVAKDLGFEGKRGVARVCMWQKRGIPSKILLDHFSYFFARTELRQEEKRE